MEPRFELDLSYSIKDNVVRMMHEQYDQIISFCKARDVDSDKAVHEIRKSFKRLRAILRLVRDAIGYSSYYRENAFCREESKLLSELRDLKVFQEDLQHIAKNYQESVDLQFIEQLQEVISELHQKQFKEVFKADLFHKIIDDVQLAKERVNSLSFYTEGFDLIAPGLMRIYGKGRKELNTVKREPSTEHFHNLRKRVKYLMYFSQILQPLYTEYFTLLSKELDKASDYLGLDHNFAELIIFVDELNKKGIPRQKKNKFIAFLQNFRNDLHHSALEKVESIYVESPKVFNKRIRQYFLNHKLHETH